MNGVETRSSRAPVRSIAVIRALQLGDLLVAVPALRSLRAGFPNAEITLIGLPWAAALAARFACYVDRFVEFGGYPGIAERSADPASVERFVAAQRTRQYDLVIQLHGDGTVSNQLALALGGRATAGYYRGNPPEGLTIAAPYPDGLHEIQRNLELVKLLGCPDRTPRLEFPLTGADQAEATRLLGAPAFPAPRWIGLHPGASVPSRRWPPERFAALGDELAARWGARIVLTGGAAERALVERVAERMTAPSLAVAGRTSLGGLAAVIAQLELFVSNDTGPAHLAAALDTPSVVVFGPGDPQRWGPLDQTRHRVLRRAVPCSPCGCSICPIDHRCLTGITVEQVLEVADTLLVREAAQCAG